MRWHSTLNAALQFDCCIGELFRGAAQEDAKGSEANLWPLCAAGSWMVARSYGLSACTLFTQHPDLHELEFDLVLAAPKSGTCFECLAGTCSICQTCPI